jgi:acyl-CoA synthetase (NDP forming)
VARSSVRRDDRPPGFADLDPVVAARSIAIVGASSDPEKISGRPLTFLLRHGFEGQIYPINPHNDVLAGVAALRSIADLPVGVDLAVVCLPASDAVRAVEALAERRVKAAVVFAGGFAELGGNGRRLQARLVDAARTHGMRLVGPNTVGFVNPLTRLAATFAAPLGETSELPIGRVAFLSQSGALATYMYAWAVQRGLAFRFFMSLGNEADLELADFLAYLSADASTRAIGAHIEGLRDGRRFLAAADLAVEHRMPVCLMKTGRTASGRRAAMSHTGSMAGSDELYDAVFRQKAITRVDDAFDLLDFLDLASRVDEPVRGPRVGVVSISGGIGVWVADLLSTFEVAVPTLARTTRQRLRDVLPPYGSADNPVDLTGAIVSNPEIVRGSAEALATDPRIDAMLLILAFQRHNAERIARDLVEVKARTSKLMLVVWMFADPSALAILDEAGIKVYDDPGRAARALGRYLNWSARVDLIRSRRHRLGSPRPGRSSTILHQLKPGPMAEHESKRLIRLLGLRTPRGELVTSADAVAAAVKRIGLPVVAKAQAPQFVHKARHGLVKLGLYDEHAVRVAFSDLMAAAKSLLPDDVEADGVLIEQMQSGQFEMIVGTQHDPTFGAIVMFGVGGSHVEALKQVAFRAPPLCLDDAREMIGDAGARELLTPKAATAVARIIVRLGDFALSNLERLESLEVNPLIVDKDNRPLALDALVVTR